MRDKSEWSVMSCHQFGESLIHFVKSSAGLIIAQCGTGDEAKAHAEQIVEEHNMVLEWPCDES